jgi:hypothetical protein
MFIKDVVIPEFLFRCRLVGILSLSGFRPMYLVPEELPVYSLYIFILAPAPAEPPVLYRKLRWSCMPFEIAFL